MKSAYVHEAWPYIESRAFKELIWPDKTAGKCQATNLVILPELIEPDWPEAVLSFAELTLSIFDLLIQLARDRVGVGSELG